MGIGTTELLIILAIVVLIFGASKLPQLGAGLGKGIQNFKKSARGDDESAETKVEKTAAVPEKKDGKEG